MINFLIQRPQEILTKFESEWYSAIAYSVSQVFTHSPPLFSFPFILFPSFFFPPPFPSPSLPKSYIFCSMGTRFFLRAFLAVKKVFNKRFINDSRKVWCYGRGGGERERRGEGR